MFDSARDKLLLTFQLIILFGYMAFLIIFPSLHIGVSWLIGISIAFYVSMSLMDKIG